MTHTANVLPGLMTPAEAELRDIFLRQVQAVPGGELIARCLQCGTCTGSCPVSHAMDLSPRQLIALFRAGDLDGIMRSRSIWLCASCYACTTRCPAGIKVTDLIYALKRTAMESRRRTFAPQVKVLATQFIRTVSRYGRLHEATLMRRYYLRTNVFRLFGVIPLVVAMARTRRLSLFPHRIRAHVQLSRIIRKARTLEMRHPSSAPPPIPAGHGVPITNGG
jgi:heterodisulfide reductase subunit C